MNSKARALFAALALSIVPARAAIPAGWSTNLNDVMVVPRASRKPVLLYFTAEWCGPCRIMGASTLRDTNVLQRLTSFSPVAIDLDANAELAARHQVSAIPTFLLLTPDGEESARHTGFIDAKTFDQWLSQGAGAIDKIVEESQKFRERERAITAVLAGPNPTAAIGDLLDLCADSHAARRTFALTGLKAIAHGHPGPLMVGLNHPKLATRIATANALRETLGSDFDFDPWAGAAEREKSIAAARQRLVTQ